MASKGLKDPCMDSNYDNFHFWRVLSTHSTSRGSSAGGLPPMSTAYASLIILPIYSSTLCIGMGMVPSIKSRLQTQPTRQERVRPLLCEIGERNYVFRRR